MTNESPAPIVAPPLSKDLKIGAGQIALALYGESTPKTRRDVYRNPMGLSFFKHGNSIAALMSVISAEIVDAQRAAQRERQIKSKAGSQAVRPRRRRNSISGDRYAGIWPVEQFAKFNVRYEQSAKPKSDLYTDLLPLINSARIELLDHPKLINQLCGLERRTARGGRDSIDHQPGAHDDLANACAGLAAINNKYGGYNNNYREWAY